MKTKNKLNDTKTWVELLRSTKIGLVLLLTI
jgi:hypothetical protein